MDWLLIIVLLPLLAAAAVGFVPGSQLRTIRGITLGASGLALLAAFIAFCSFKVGGGFSSRPSGLGSRASGCIFISLPMVSILVSF
ncbi:MAG: hypothetical protein CM1200mP29_01980 [Verrucomicrobiota bacterium]|nr:MAG: hypothetical protein CM1200mP29_01980 [Verrucomicrobiota bacterium]